MIQFDIDLTAFGRRHGELPDKDRMIQSDAGLVQKVADAFDAAFAEAAQAPNLMIGTVVSGDRFVADAAAVRWLQREFGALATEMEGAAVGYTCQLNACPSSSCAAFPTPPTNPRPKTSRPTWKPSAATPSGSCGG